MPRGSNILPAALALPRISCREWVFAGLANAVGLAGLVQLFGSSERPALPAHTQGPHARVPLIFLMVNMLFEVVAPRINRFSMAQHVRVVEAGEAVRRSVRQRIYEVAMFKAEGERSWVMRTRQQGLPMHIGSR